MTHPHLRLASNPHDRAAYRRTDEGWLAGRWADPRTRVLVVAGTRVRPRAERIEWVSPEEAPPGVRVLLGERDGTAMFAVVAAPDVAADAEEEWRVLRGVLPLLAADPTGNAPLVFHALGIAEWLSVTRFCPRCGGPLEPRACGHELVCPEGHLQFPRSDPAVIMLVTDGDPGSEEERCLLGRQASWPPGRYSTLAGFCEPGETLEDAVRREVAEETRVVVGEVTYFGNQPWPLPSSLMLGFVARAVSTGIDVGQDELEDARWFTRSEIKSLAEAGTLVMPGGVSISHSLVEHWYGGPVPGHW